MVANRNVFCNCQKRHVRLSELW